MSAIFAPLDHADDDAELRLALRELVRRGIVREVKAADGQDRYEVAGDTVGPGSAEPVGADASADLRVEPCPVCRAREGFDGGARCNVCHVAWPPEMY